MPHVLAWDIETVPDLRGYAAASGLEGKKRRRNPDAMGGTTAQKTCDQSGVPAVSESGQIAQTVLFNSTNIVCNRGVP